MISLRRLAAVDKDGSLSNRMRAKRFEYFNQLFDRLPKPIRMLDVGGTVRFWECRGWTERSDVDITLLNLVEEESTSKNIHSTVGDATALDCYNDGDFDVVFSNSVIEHLFTFDSQRAMASEVARVGKAFWIQTPNYWFPIEPHFHWLGWQWYPRSVRVAMIQRIKCGHRGPCSTKQAAEAAVDEVRLMSHREMQEVFPKAQIWRERVLGATKSLVAIQGFGA
jgi:hypothetical protein